MEKIDIVSGPIGSAGKPIVARVAGRYRRRRDRNRWQIMRNLMAICLSAAFCAGFAAEAQAAECGEQSVSSASPRRQRGIGSPEDGQPWLQIEVAPQIVSQNPLRRGAEATDSTAVSLTLGMTQQLSPGLDLEIEGGPSVDLDSDDDAELESESTVGGTAMLVLCPILFGTAPFISAGYERSYEGFFEGGIIEENLALEIGTKLGWEVGDLSVEGELATRWVQSFAEPSDYLAVRISPELDYVIAESIFSLYFEGQAEWRWYQHRDSVILDERRDRHLSAFVGFDFGPLVSRLFRLDLEQPRNGSDPEPIVQHALLGIRWSDVDSNVEEGDEESEFQFAPAIAIRFGFH